MKRYIGIAFNDHRLNVIPKYVSMVVMPLQGMKTTTLILLSIYRPAGAWVQRTNIFAATSTESKSLFDNRISAGNYKTTCLLTNVPPKNNNQKEDDS